MNIVEKFLKLGEYAGAGLYEDANRSIFFRKAKATRRWLEHTGLQEYTGHPLYPSGAIDRTMQIEPCFMSGITMSLAFAEKEPELAQYFKRDFNKYTHCIPLEHTVACAMALHSLPYYERVVKEGFDSYIPRIEKIRDIEIKEGLLEVMAGVKTYHARCLEFLKENNADTKLIEALEQVPMKPARNIYEAILTWNFVMYIDGCDNLGCLASGLLPYFKGENIVELLENLYDNLDINNGYSMALHCHEGELELTLQCLEASKGRRRPQIELLVDETTPKIVWKKAFEVMRS